MKKFLSKIPKFLFSTNAFIVLSSLLGAVTVLVVAIQSEHNPEKREFEKAPPKHKTALCKNRDGTQTTIADQTELVKCVQKKDEVTSVDSE